MEAENAPNDAAPPRRKLTSKNLFDDVFASIPATSFLHYGPQTLMEELAMQEENAESGVGQGASTHDAEEDALLFDADPSGSEAAPSLAEADALWAGPVQGAAGAASHASRRKLPGAGIAAASAGGGFNLQLDVDAEDEAFREATKHAALLSEFRAAEAEKDAELAERHRQRMAEQVAALTGDDDRRGQQAQQQHASSHGDRRGGGTRLNDKDRDRGHGRDGRQGPSHGAAGGGGEGRGSDGTRGATGAAGTHEEVSGTGHMGEAAMTRPARQLSAEEQVALMPPGLSRLYTGRCVMLRANRGFGFISPDLGGPDVYFIKDNVVLTFTRLALQAYYTKHGRDIPLSIVLPPARWDAPELTGDATEQAPLVVSSLSDLSPRPPPAKPAADDGAADGKAPADPQGTSEGTDSAPTDAVPTKGEAPPPPPTPSHTLAKDSTGSTIELNPNHRPALASMVSLSASSLNNSMVMMPMPSGMAMGTPSGVFAGGAAESHPIPPITEAEKTFAARAATLLNDETAQLLQWAMDSCVTSISNITPGGLHDGLDGGGGLLGNLQPHGQQHHHHHHHNQLHNNGGGGGGGGGGEESTGGDPGGVVVAHRDPLTFTVQRNKATGGGSRLLRAEFIRGMPETAFSLPLEQSWFYPLFPGAIGVKAADAADGADISQAQQEEAVGEAKPSEAQSSSAVSSANATGPILVRYTGMVRAYNVEDRRGYIRCDEPSAKQDVCFYASAFLWDPALPPAQHIITERLRVTYSVAGVDRNGKYLATLMTSGVDGKPFGRDNIAFQEEEREGRGGRRGGGGGGTGGGGNALRDEVSMVGSGMGGGESGLKRSRAEEEEQLLLFDEDDYAMI